MSEWMTATLCEAMEVPRTHVVYTCATLNCFIVIVFIQVKEKNVFAHSFFATRNNSDTSWEFKKIICVFVLNLNNAYKRQHVHI